MWRPQIEALAGRFHVIAPDLRGFGNNPPADGQYTLEFMVDDVLRLLGEPAVLCGVSMGGYIALRAAERAPDRIRALVLADTRSESDTNDAKLKRADAIKTVKEQGVAVYADGFLKSAFHNAAAAEKARSMILGNSPIGICAGLLALASRTDTTAFLPQIKVPTLVLVGEHDALTPPSAAQSLAGKIPAAQFHALPAAGHISNLENPAEFNRHLLAFLERIR